MKTILKTKAALVTVAALLSLAIAAATPILVQSIPTELIGKWKWGTINPTWFEDKYTGEYKGHAGGVSAYFDFDKNGHFKHYVYIEQNSNGWKTQTFTTMEGQLIVDGDIFRLKVEKGSYKARSNRVERQNFDRPMTDDERATQSKRIYKWSMGTDQNGQPQINVINGGEGNAVGFRQDKG